jgi:hypothetical protein
MYWDIGKSVDPVQEIVKNDDLMWNRLGSDRQTPY